VKGIYDAFGRGDIPWILEQLADDVTWEYGAVANDVPWLKPRRGRSDVGGFFQTVAENLEFRSLSIHSVLGDGPLVVALADLDILVKRTGKSLVEKDEPHLWHFDAQGKVVKFKHAADTYGHRVALGL
jgi:uncharacterized protein